MSSSDQGLMRHFAHTKLHYCIV